MLEKWTDLNLPVKGTEGEDWSSQKEAGERCGVRREAKEKPEGMSEHWLTAPDHARVTHRHHQPQLGWKRKGLRKGHTVGLLQNVSKNWPSKKVTFCVHERTECDFRKWLSTVKKPNGSGHSVNAHVVMNSYRCY